MVATIILCLCITGLCCYTTHMLLSEHRNFTNQTVINTQADLIKLLMVRDAYAMKKPLTLKKNSGFYPDLSGKDPLYPDAEIIDITPHVKRRDARKVDNCYPIAPKSQQSRGKTLDVRI